MQQRRAHKPVRVVCLGGGYVAITLSRALRPAINKGQVELTIVSRDNYHACHGLVGEMLTGRIQSGQIASPARRIFSPARFQCAEIETIDTQSRTVTVSRSLDGRQYQLTYDHLVLALGSLDDLSRVPGIAEHAVKLKTYNDCFRVRNHLLTMLELAEIEADPEERRRLLTFVIAGGNYAGVELATEFADYFQRLTQREYPRIDPTEIRIMLVHSGQTILPELNAHHPRLVRSAVRYIEGLRSLGLEMRLQTRLASATPDEAVLNTGEHVPTRTIISCTGTAQNPLLDQLPFERDERGRVVTDAFTRVRGETQVWAAGDCAAVPHPKGGTVPMLGTYAMFVGTTVGKNIMRAIEGKPLERYSFAGIGDALSLGRRMAVGHVRGIEVTGLLAWLSWRVLLWYFVPTWDRKLRLLFDWCIWPLVGRDIVSISIGDRQGISRAVYEPGQLIIRQGDVGKRLYVIGQGKVEVVRDSADGEQVLARLGPGQHFGETAVFQNVRRTASVRALTRVQLLVVSQDEAVSLASTIPTFGAEARQLPIGVQNGHAPATEEPVHA